MAYSTISNGQEVASMPLKMIQQLIQAYPAFLALIRTLHVRFSAKNRLDRFVRSLYYLNNTYDGND